MVGLAPRALKDSMRPRRSVGAFGRPLNFTVRSHVRGIQRREECEGLSQGHTSMRATTTDSVLVQSVFAWRPRRARAAGPFDEGRGARPRRFVPLSSRTCGAVRQVRIGFVPAAGRA